LGHAGLERIVVVELVPEAVPAARLFGSTNRGVVDDPRVEVRVADARHFLAVSGRQFDVIVSDLFVPWESQTGYLYTVEHYRAAQRALRPGGLFCQWLPMFQLGPGEFELIADSFASVFPHITLWWAEQSPGVAVLGLVGTAEPLEFDRTAAARGLASVALEGKAAPGAKDPLLASGEEILSLLIGRWRVRHPDWLNTDEHPRVEFQAPAAHASNRKLSGQRLRDYFEERLVPLEDGVVLGDAGEKSRSRSIRLETQRRNLEGPRPSP
jgi:spermidine synthase